MSRIDEVISRIQEKWGHQAVQSARQLSRQDKFYSSGFLSLDNLIGGFPRSQVTELVGRPTSGMTTLAYYSLARSQRQGANVVIIDSLSHLDMNTAAASGANLENLVLVEIEETPYC
jgi:RecA/RadA recombinase